METPSFIFNSKFRFGALLGALILGWLASAGYCIYLNPEVQFWKMAYQKKFQWADAISKQFASKYVFVGGSSCAFQIDAAMLTEDFHLPSVNMGMAAGMGSKGVMAVAMSVVNPSDTVVIGIEPGLLIGPPNTGPLGWQILLATGAIWDPRTQLALAPFQISEIISSLRPGLMHCVTMAAKLVVGRPLYRYGEADILRGGGVSTEVRNEVSPFIPVELHLHQSEKQWISMITKSRKSVAYHWIYLLPAHLFPSKYTDEATQQFDAFLMGFCNILPVVGAGENAVWSDPSLFADSALHLTRKAMLQRTGEVAEILY